MEAIKVKCEVCGKEIMGFSKKQVDYLRHNHLYTHKDVNNDENK